MQKFPSGAATKTLKRISEFFSVIVCAVMVKDLNVLLERCILKQIQMERGNIHRHEKVQRKLFQVDSNV
jgi:hypothetical protein